jgi:N-methylhydantoinase B
MTVRTAPSSYQNALTLTVHWNKLRAIVDEATATLLHTAFSRSVTDALDFSCALFDENGEMIAQGRHGLPSFLGTMALAVKDFLKEFPPDRLDPGDSLITTDPWIGASQINDVVFVTPIFRGRTIVGYAACISHSPDVGGRILSADSTEIFEEGFRLPIVKLFVRDAPNEDLFRIIRLNVRVPDVVVGDLLAQLASNSVMARGVVEFLDTTGVPDLKALSREILSRSERAMRQAISAIPAGSYSAEVETDGFDDAILLRCSIRVDADSVSIDLKGSSPQGRNGVNSAWRYIYAELAHAVICVARPAGPVNGGTLKPISATAPLGTVVNAAYPAALGARAMVSMYMQALVFRALSEAVPDRVMADAGTPPAIPAFLGQGNNGRPYVEVIRVNGGLGARPASDGISALGWPAPVSGTPVEIHENEMPVLLLRKELADGTGGAGQYRGGLGHYFVWRSDASEPITVALRQDRVYHPPLGLHGGLSGAPSQAFLNDNPVHPKKTLVLHPGDVLHIRTAGGGGYGDPKHRDRQRLSADLLDGYVTPEQAERDYPGS